MPSEPKPEWSGTYDFVTKDIPTAEGVVPLTGLTVRALRRALEDCGPDDLVILMDADDAGVSRGFVPVGGVASDSPHAITVLLSEQAATAMKDHLKGKR